MQQTRQLLDDIGNQLKVEQQDNLPDWCKHIAVHRDRFIGTAVGKLDDGNAYPVVLYVPMAIKVIPREITWLRYYCREEWKWLLDDQHDDILDYCESYEFHGEHLCFSSELGLGDVQDLVVLHSLSFRNGFLVAPHPPERFEFFVANHPKINHSENRGRSVSHSGAAMKAAVFASLLEEYPWLSPEIFDSIWVNREKAARSSEGSSSSSSTHLSWSDTVIDAVGDIDVSSMLGAARARLEDLDSDVSRHFYVKVLGGGSTLRVVGMVYDRVAVRYRAHVAPFVVKFKFCTQQSFSMAAHGSELNAKELAAGCAARATYFYEVWLEQGCPDEIDFKTFEAGFTESFEWLDWASTLDVESNAFAAMALIREFVPMAA
jgi:hypothetical protein